MLFRAWDTVRRLGLGGKRRKKTATALDGARDEEPNGRRAAELRAVRQRLHADDVAFELILLALLEEE